MSAARWLRETWEHKTGERLPQVWDAAFLDWIQRYTLPLVTDAIQSVGVAGYSDDGERRAPNIRDVPKYAAVEQAEASEPGMRQCYFVRGRMRKKYFCGDNDEVVLELLRRVKRAGVTGFDMDRAVDDCETLEDCFAALGMDRGEFRVAMGHPVVDLPPRERVYIKEDDPEWPLWNAYLRKKTGRGAPMNKHFGWFFPSRLPPTDSFDRTAGLATE
ncbi:hypothetical protein QMZ05_02150 [Bradyrhizobium sp. INPA03-11B]|uniref:hypothetical protein n=1 Tax=Bradyrhizobium sp. INPA03-11B TaxID=418598 RepID=UPI00338E3DFF